MKILIIGGAGAFGSFYATLFSQSGFDVSITDSDCESAKKICQEHCLKLLEKENFKGFDIVIVSVPNEVAPKVINTIGKKLSKGTLLFDFCSVKSGVVSELEKLSTQGLELASIHPMHGPRVASIVGQPVVCIQINKGEKLAIIKRFFDERGANFFFSTAKEHDETLAIVQGLTHFSQFVSAAVLKEINVNLKDTLRFGSPNYSLFLSVIARVVLQNPELYAQIQLSNPYNKKIREVFVRKAKELNSLCAKGPEELKKIIIEETKLFKDPDAFLFESDKAVNAFNYVVSILRANIGKRFLVQNTHTHSFHYGAIKEIVENELIMIEGQSKTRIHIPNVGLITKPEVFEWKKKNLEQRHLDYSFLIPTRSEPKIILNALNKLISECNFELLDEYVGKNIPEEQKSITVRSHFFGDSLKKEVDDRTKEIIKGMGFVLR